jgi:hypothetical protein
MKDCDELRVMEQEYNKIQYNTMQYNTIQYNAIYTRNAQNCNFVFTVTVMSFPKLSKKAMAMWNQKLSA